MARLSLWNMPSSTVERSAINEAIMDSDELERTEKQRGKREWNELVPYALGAVFPLPFLIFAFAILPGSKVGELLPIFLLVAPSVIGGACCVQSFRKSSNGVVRALAVLLACGYVVPMLMVWSLLVGPSQDRSVDSGDRAHRSVANPFRSVASFDSEKLSNGPLFHHGFSAMFSAISAPPCFDPAIPRKSTRVRLAFRNL